MKDKLSALLDGDLDEQSARLVLDSLGREPELRSEWEVYCAIGDVLRGDRDGAPGLVSRVMAEIESEPTLLAPPRVRSTPTRSRVWGSLMPLAASVMGVAAVGWVAHTLYSEPEQGARIAGNTPGQSASDVATLPPAAPVPVAYEDPHREYVFAHQAMTGGGPIPGPVQYVRTVSVGRQDLGR